MQFLATLFAFEWETVKNATGHIQWRPVNNQLANAVPDAHIPGKRNAPMMLTTDIALKKDPAYKKISKRFLDNPKEFELAFAKAWFKLELGGLQSEPFTND